MVDKEIKDISMDDFQVNTVDLGPPSIEGGIHNAKLSLDILASWVEEKEREIEVLKDQVEIITSYVKSIVDTNSHHLSVMSRPPKGLNTEVLDQINRYKYFGSALEEWVSKLIFDGNLYLQ